MYPKDSPNIRCAWHLKAEVEGYLIAYYSAFNKCEYHDADKSLARPGRKQARKHVRNARDFNNIETRAVIKFFSLARQGAEGNSCHSDGKIGLLPSWSG